MVNVALCLSTLPQGQVEGGFMGRTNKLADGCYSFWQGGAFPVLAQLLAQQAQRGQQAQHDAADGRPAADGAGAPADAPALLAAAQRLCALLLEDDAAGEGSDGDGSPGSPGSGPGPAGSGQAAASAAAAFEGQTLREWVNSLPHLSPQAAAARQAERLRPQLDAAVEASLEAEEAYAAAKGGPAGGPLQQQAVAALQRAADLQQVCVQVCSSQGLGACKGSRLPGLPLLLLLLAHPCCCSPRACAPSARSGCQAAGMLVDLLRLPGRPAMLASAAFDRQPRRSCALCLLRRRWRVANSMQRRSHAAQQPCWM